MLINLETYNNEQYAIEIKKEDFEDVNLNIKSHGLHIMKRYEIKNINYHFWTETHLRNNKLMLDLCIYDFKNNRSYMELYITLRSLTDAESLIEICDDNLEYIINIKQIRPRDEKAVFKKDIDAMNNFTYYFDVSVDTSKVDIPNI